MNNRTQQRFDRSIRESLAEAEAARDLKPRRDVRPPRKVAKQHRTREPRGRLYLDLETGATVWEPAT